jgi:hypothetical protein
MNAEKNAKRRSARKKVLFYERKKRLGATSSEGWLWPLTAAIKGMPRCALIVFLSLASTQLAAQNRNAKVDAVAAVNSSTTTQEAQNDANKAWGIAIKLIQVRGGFISMDALEDIAGFSLKKEFHGKGYESAYGATGSGGSNFSVTDYKTNISKILENGAEKDIDAPQSHVTLTMPENGCVTTDQMKSDLSGLGLEYIKSSTLVNATDYFSKENEYVDIAYQNYNIQKALGSNPEKNRCVNKVSIRGTKLVHQEHLVK